MGTMLYVNDINEGYLGQCDRLIQDQNQYHFNCTRFHPIEEAHFLQFTPLSILSSHNDINLGTITFNGNGPLLESLSVCFLFSSTKFYELHNKNWNGA